MPATPALFFDRDGVLNRDIGYPHLREQIEWTPGVVEAIAAVNAAGALVMVVTNQSGVARGFFDEAAVRELHAWMAETLVAQGARIDGFAYCPHHPEATVAAYRRVCDCRKPKPGMIEALIAEHGIDRARSVLIGDKISDLEAAQAAGVRGLLYTGGSLLPYVLEGLAQAASSRHRRRARPAAGDGTRP